MGNNHPTIELIRDITEYVNARYESSDRVVSYEAAAPEFYFAERSATPPASYKAAPMMGSMPPAPPAEQDRLKAPKARKLRLPKLFSNRTPGEKAYSTEEQCYKMSPEPSVCVDDAEGSFAVASRIEPPEPYLGDAGIRSLEELVNNPAESFAAMLFRLIDEKGLTDPEVYNKAGVSRQTFSKIRSKEDYAPSKDTVISLAMALGLKLDEVQDLLNTAGFALSNSSKSDIVISYFFEHGMHDLGLLNETLYEMGFAVIGER